MLVNRRSRLAALLLLALLAVPGFAAVAAPARSSCQTDGEVPAAESRAIEAASRRFVGTLFGGDPGRAYDEFAAAAKNSVTRQAFTAGVGPMIAPLADFSDLSVVHRYRIEASPGTGYAKMLCRAETGGAADMEVSVLAGAVQAYVVLRAKMRNNDWAAVVWLVREQESWRIQHFQINVVTLAGKSAEQVLAMARAERRERHDVNAYLLYAAAFELAYRGPNMRLPVEQEIAKERADLPTPAEFEGKPPFTWRYGDASFTVRRAGPLAHDGKIYLLIAQQIPPWHDNGEAAARNRALIDAFTRAHPDYAAAFAGIVAEAEEKDGHRLYRTMVEAGAAR